MGDDSNSESNSSLDSPLNSIYYGGIQFLKEDKQDEAIKKFENVIATDTEKTIWGFNSHIQLIKIKCKSSKYNEAGDKYLERSVIQNQSEDQISLLLDEIAKCAEVRKFNYYSIYITCYLFLRFRCNSIV